MLGEVSDLIRGELPLVAELAALALATAADLVAELLATMELVNVGDGGDLPTDMNVDIQSIFTPTLGRHTTKPNRPLMQTTLKHPVYLFIPMSQSVLACLALLLGLSIASCDKEPRELNYGLFSPAKRQLVRATLDQLADYTPTGDTSYTGSFVGEIGGRKVTLEGNPARPTPYFVSIRPLAGVYVPDGASVGSPDIKYGEWLEVDISGGQYPPPNGGPPNGISPQFQWQFAIPKGDYPDYITEEPAYVDAALTALFVPGAELPMLTSRQTTDSVFYGKASTIKMCINTGLDGVVMRQSQAADEFRSIRCISFSKTVEATGTRYRIELDLRHGLAASEIGQSTDFLPMVGKLKINWLFEG